ASYYLSFFLFLYVDPPDLHSFPTRRSSDLLPRLEVPRHPAHRRQGGCRGGAPRGPLLRPARFRQLRDDGAHACGGGARHHLEARSEEHTSELQSRGHLVCRLLLEKKKNKLS